MQKSTLSFITKSLFALLFLVSIHTQQASAQCLVNEGFEGNFPPSGWQATNVTGSGLSCNYNWQQGTSGIVLCSGSSYTGTPAVVVHGGSKAAAYDSWWINTGGTADLITPAMDFTQYPALNPGGYHLLSFWVYNYQTASGLWDSIGVYINTSPTINGATFLGDCATNYCNGYSGLLNYSSTTGYFNVVKPLPASFNTSTHVYIILHAYSYYGYDMFIDDFSTCYIGPCQPPASSPTNMVFNPAPTASAIYGSFTGVTPAPTGGYLVVASQGPLNTLPTSGVNYTVGQSLGNGQVVSTSLSTTFTASGLTPLTTYTFTVFPYTGNNLSNPPNLCSGPSYRTTSPLTGQATTAAPKIYTWNQIVSGSWAVGTNWTPTRTTPDPSDIMVFDNGFTDTATNVPNQTIQRLVISNGSSVRLRGAANNTLTFYSDNIPTTNELDIRQYSSLILDGTTSYLTLAFGGTGSTALIDGNLEFANTTVPNQINFNACTATFTSNGTLTLGSSNTGQVLYGLSTSAPFNVIMYGTYNHKYTTVSGPAIPVLGWQPGSTVMISGYTNLGAPPNWGPCGLPPCASANWNQPFSNVIYNCPNQVSSTNVNLAGGPRNVSGNFSVMSTGAGSVIMSSANLAYNDTVNNFTQMGGRLDLCDGTTGNTTHVFNVAGSFNQSGGRLKATTTSPTPNVTLNYYGPGPKILTYYDTVTGPVTHRLSTSVILNANPSGPLAVSNTFMINNLGGIRVSNTSNNPLATSLTLNYAPGGQHTLTYDTAGNCYITPRIWPLFTPPYNMTVNVGLGNTVKFPTFNRAAVIAGTLKFVTGDIDLGNDSMIIGTGALNPGYIDDTSLVNVLLPNVNPVIYANMGNIRIDSLGSLTRWITTASVPTASTGVNSAFSANNIKQTPGFFPISYGAANRNVLVYFLNTSVITQAGTLTVTHNHTTGLTAFSPSVMDGLYAIDKQTNANWTITPGSGFTLNLAVTNPLNIKITAASLFICPNGPGNLRLMHYFTNPTVPGVHFGGSGAPPIFSAERTGLVYSDLSTPFYIGANHVDIQGVFTAIHTGNWSANNTWDINYPPSLNDYAVINPNVNVTVDQNTPATYATPNAAANACKGLNNYGTLNAVGTGKMVTIDSALLNYSFVNIGGTDAVQMNGNGIIPPNINGIMNYSSFNMSGGTLTMGGGAANYNKPFNNYGNFTFSGGTFNLNGNLMILNNSYFSQTGGNIIVDGNAGGNTNLSVLHGTPLVAFRTPNIILTGGSLTILDPHADYNPPTNAFEYNSTVNINDTTAHTFIFGDTTNTSADANYGGGALIPVPFLIYPNLGAGRFSFGNLIIGGGAQAASSINRWVSPRGPVNVKGNMTIYNNGEYRMNGFPLYINGDLTLQSTGFFTADSTSSSAATNTCWNWNTNPPSSGSGGTGPTLYFGQFNNAVPATPLAATNFQHLVGANLRNSVNGATANLRNIYVKNKNGVQFNAGNLSFSGWLGFYNDGGLPSHIYMAQSSILTEYPYNPVAPFNQTPANCISASALNGWVVGTGQYIYSKHAYGTGPQPTPISSYLFPIGDSFNYTPVVFNSSANSCNHAGDIQVGSVYDANYNYNGTNFNPLNVVRRHFPVLGVNNFGFIANTLSANLTWAAGDPTPTFGYTYAKVAVDSGVTAHYVSFPSPSLQTPTSIKAGNLGAVLMALPTFHPQLSGNYLIGDSCPPTQITVQPNNNSACIGGAAVSFCVTATGAGLTYQWYFNGTPISGATQPCLVISNITPAQGGPYICQVMSVCYPPIWSNQVQLSIGAAPYITTQPLSAAGCAGNFCDTIIAAVTGTANKIKWFHDGNWLQAPGPNNNVIEDSAINLGITTYRLIICPVTINDSGWYWATFSNGCMLDSTIFVHLTVYPAPPASVIASGPTSFCGGSGVTLNANTAPGYTYQWYNANASPANLGIAGIQSTYLAQSSGLYYVKISDANGCSDSSNAISVQSTALPVPPITALGNTTFCAGNTVNLTTPVVTGYFYQWQVNTGSGFVNIPGANSNTYTASSSGDYRVFINNNNNCTSNSAPLTVNVIALPNNTITASGPLNICTGSQVLLTGPTGTGLTYQWQLGGVNIPGANNFSYAANVSGYYTVQITSANCTSTSTQVNVHVTNHPPANILTPAGNSISICADQNVSLQANTGNGYTYKWLHNNVIVPNQTASSLVASSAGTYQVVVSDNGCDSTSSPFTVFVNPIPTVAISQTQNVLTAVGVFTQYQWYLNSNLIAGATAPSYTVQTPGNYSVWVKDANGCVATSASWYAYPTGVVNTNINGAIVNIYPNPASKIIYIDAAVTVNAKISAVDGKVVMEKNDAKSLDISELPNGVYMIRITNTAGDLLKIEKLVKNDF